MVCAIGDCSVWWIEEEVSGSFYVGARWSGPHDDATCMYEASDATPVVVEIDADGVVIPELVIFELPTDELSCE